MLLHRANVHKSGVTPDSQIGGFHDVWPMPRTWWCGRSARSDQIFIVSLTARFCKPPQPESCSALRTSILDTVSSTSHNFCFFFLHNPPHKPMDRPRLTLGILLQSGISEPHPLDYSRQRKTIVHTVYSHTTYLVRAEEHWGILIIKVVHSALRTMLRK